jgi:CheY-like chemotaxis protein
MGHILVLENEEGIALLLEQILGTRGHVVTVLDQGEAALAFLAGQRADLLLTDLFLQGMSGLEVLAEMERLGVDLPTVVVSGHIDGEIRERLEASSLVRGWFRKPFSVPDLVARVEASLGEGERE